MREMNVQSFHLSLLSLHTYSNITYPMESEEGFS